MPLMFMAILAVYIGTNAYISARLYAWLGLGALPAVRIVWAATFVFLASVFFVTQIWDIAPPRVSRALNLLGGWYLSAYIWLLMLVPLCDLLTGGRGGRAAALAMVAFAAGVTVLGAVRAKKMALTQYAFEGNTDRELRLALISDVHIGEIIGERELSKIVDAINSVDADYVFIAGDALDAGPKYVTDKEAAGAQFKRIRSKNGIFACLGNHDGGFRGQENDAAELLEGWGVTVLRDEVIKVGEIYVAGRKDYGMSGGKDSSEARTPADVLLKDVPKEAFTVVLDHQPYDLDGPRAAGADLILCGHTHKGQLFPGNLITGRVYRIDYGMEKDGGCVTVVSSGAGTWGPRVRTGSKNEVVSITVRPKNV